MPNMQFFNYPGTEANSESFHYSQAVKIGTVVKTSGQGGWDESGNITSNVEKQVAIAFENVEKALKEVDSRLSWENVYAVRSYHISVEETFDMVTSNFKKVIPSHRPIWTCVEIGKLGIEGMVIEIEVEAHFPF
jgi:enamine deaminase RidA (YjgF/YER057c/UK114 family)